MAPAAGIFPTPPPHSQRRQDDNQNTIGNSRITMTFHHFIFREIFLVIISPWFASKHSGRIISHNLSDLHLLPHLFFASDICNHYIRKFWGN